ncbi:MAG: zinc ribbon domain-containing protein [Spongiibacteraceae bacterium]
MSETCPTRLDYDTEKYWRGSSEQQLIIARCNECEHWIHPPRSCCPACWSDNIGHQQASGRATLYSFTIQPGKPSQPPLIMGWAELEEQERLIIVGPLLNASPDTVRIGTKLQLQWFQYKNTFVPAFNQEPEA